MTVRATVLIIPGSPRAHFPLPLLGEALSRNHGMSLAALPCACGWRSTARPFTSEPIPLLLAEHADHVRSTEETTTDD